MFKSLEQSFKTLKQCAHNHALKLSEQKALDSAYKELVPQQYRSVLNRVKKKVPCKGKNQTCYCGGAAEIILEMQARRFMFFIIYIIQKKKKNWPCLILIISVPLKILDYFYLKWFIGSTKLFTNKF